jgi:hypothetical protein
MTIAHVYQASQILIGTNDSVHFLSTQAMMFAL